MVSLERPPRIRAPHDPDLGSGSGSGGGGGGGPPKPPATPERELTQKEANEYFQSLQETKRDEEKVRDQAVLLILGGALTLSFQLVASILEAKKSLNSVGWLAGAWLVWAVALAGTLLNYTRSINLHEKLKKMLADGVRKRSKLMLPQKRWLTVVDNVVVAGAIAGFFLFGIFALRNLNVLPPTTTITTSSSAISEGSNANEEKASAEEKEAGPKEREVAPAQVGPLPTQEPQESGGTPPKAP